MKQNQTAEIQFVSITYSLNEYTLVRHKVMKDQRKPLKLSKNIRVLSRNCTQYSRPM